MTTVGSSGLVRHEPPDGASMPDGAVRAWGMIFTLHAQLRHGEQACTTTRFTVRGSPGSGGMARRALVAVAGWCRWQCLTTVMATAAVACLLDYCGAHRRNRRAAALPIAPWPSRSQIIIHRSRVDRRGIARNAAHPHLRLGGIVVELGARQRGPVVPASPVPLVELRPPQRKKLHRRWLGRAIVVPGSRRREAPASSRSTAGGDECDQHGDDDRRVSDAPSQSSEVHDRPGAMEASPSGTPAARGRTAGRAARRRRRR